LPCWLLSAVFLFVHDYHSSSFSDFPARAAEGDLPRRPCRRPPASGISLKKAAPPAPFGDCFFYNHVLLL
jgi:hypothetical protein